MNDFEQEVPMYLLDKKINKILFNLKLPKGEINYLNNLNACYRELIKNNIISKNETFFKCLDK